MDQVAGYQHKELAAGRWATLSLAEQMGNIGSEVSRSLRWYGHSERRFQSSFDRALELLDLSIASAQQHHQSTRLTELCRAREEFCDYFYGDNSWGTDPRRMQRYYDQFISLVRESTSPNH